VGAAVVGFLLVVSARARPADPESRLPERFRLAGLIEREQEATRALRARVVVLRRRVEVARRDATGQRAGMAALDDALRRAKVVAGLVAVRGPGLRVVLDDALRPDTPADPPKAAKANPNDLVIHSQDVQAVVNALWRAGAEAIAVNGERLVGTSGVLCVGNTLLLNGTVHSPPYVVEAVGANRDRFEADRLVRRFRADADAFGLRFAVRAVADLEIPAFDGAVDLAVARPVRR
jgi:uncharacterized protein YlxW (UPF0749 family)